MILHFFILCTLAFISSHAQNGCVPVACKCQIGYTTEFYIDENGCEMCNCVKSNPCIAALCPINTKCVADPITNEARCIPIENPCNLVDCQAGFTCIVKPDGNPKCVPIHAGVCNLFCKRGYRCRIIKGHPVCVPRKCLPFVCPKNCKYGTFNSTDENGCTICNCVKACMFIKCSAGYECRDDPLDPQEGGCVKVDPCITDVSQCKCAAGVPTLIAGSSDVCKRCSCDNPCQFETCPEGTTCVNTEVICVRAPCRVVAQCKPSKCKVGIELPNIFCGRGLNRTDCPDGYFCNIDPLDRFAVCCPNIDPCKGFCKIGQRCVLEEVQCVKAPCLPVPRCLPECPLYKCAEICLDGYVYDENGCRTCECFKI